MTSFTCGAIRSPVAEDVGTRGSKTAGHDDSGEKNDDCCTVQDEKPSETSDDDASNRDYEEDLPSDASGDLIELPEEGKLGSGSDSARLRKDLSSCSAEQDKSGFSEIAIEEASSSEEEVEFES